MPGLLLHGRREAVTLRSHELCIALSVLGAIAAYVILSG